MKSVNLSSQERLSLVSDLATLISSGIPILEAVESLISESKGNLLKILKILKEDLNQGKSVSESFARSPKAFDAVTVNLIKASEEAGTLDTTLRDLAQNIRDDAEFSNKVKAATAYPLLVLIVLFVVILINLFFVIPRIAGVFIKLKVPTPLPTKILIATSNVVTHNVLYFVLGTLALIALIVLILKTKKHILLNIVFAVPGISKLIREIDLTRFTRSMSLLLKSGIPIDEALELCQNIVLKSEIKSAISDSLKLVRSGKSLASGLAKHKKIPAFMLRIIEAGEKSGTLEKSLDELAQQFDSRVSIRLKALTTLIEPILLLFVGLMVGAIMLSITAPIYKLIGSIGPRGQ